MLTIIPLWFTWIVFDFVLGQLSHFGMPWVRALSKNIQHDSPALAQWLLNHWFQDILAALITPNCAVRVGLECKLRAR
ncbi:MAG: hypothetical protein R3F37_00560 [Candidatus Competibacteraceae bacterium]